MFSCEFSEISRNTFFTEHIWVSAFEQRQSYPLLNMESGKIQTADRRPRLKKNNHQASLCEKSCLISIYLWSGLVIYHLALYQGS